MIIRLKMHDPESLRGVVLGLVNSGYKVWKEDEVDKTTGLGREVWVCFEYLIEEIK